MMISVLLLAWRVRRMVTAVLSIWLLIRLLLGRLVCVVWSYLVVLFRVGGMGWRWSIAALLCVRISTVKFGNL